MLPTKLAFVDIETTGMRSFYDRVIEIAIHRVEKNKIIKSFHSLINPQAHLPPEITMLTGITATDLENAPAFREIKDEILETLSDCVFVAHNVRFDYSFLKNEFRRLDISFSPKHFCTVRLSRYLYPQFKHHNLDSIIKRFGLACQDRHRAFTDAKMIFEFYNQIMKDFPPSKIEKAVDKALKKPSAPVKLQMDLSSLSENPGVYIFYSENQTPLYIGKSKNLKERILSHFSADIRSPLEMKISQQVVNIKTIETAGELGALFLESQMIKKMLPLYNQKSRIKHELIVLKKITTKNGYHTVKMENLKKPNLEFRASSLDSIFGLFKSRKQAKSFLADIAKKHSLCEKLLELESTGRSSSQCFAYRLNRCKGACTGKEKPIFYNLRFTAAFSSTKIKPWPFTGTIIIEEVNYSKKEYFLINNWCYLSNIKIDSEGNNNTTTFEDTAFDLDIYKILTQFLSHPQNYQKIKMLQTPPLASDNPL